MAVPAFWATPFSFATISSGPDVNGIISALDTALRAAGWTDESGTHVGPWRTPTRSDGIFFKVAVSRVSATRLGWNMLDQSGVSVYGGANLWLTDIDVAGNTVDIYAGTLHCCININRAAQECIWFCVLDQTPEPINFPRAVYMGYCGARSSDGTYRGYGWNFTNHMPQWLTAYGQRQAALQRVKDTTYFRRTVNNTQLFCPPEFADSGQAPYMFYGRIPQAIVIDSTGMSAGNEVTVPIDAGVNAVFKLVGCAAYMNQMIAFRKS